MSDDLKSRPYKPNPEKCCEGCVFGTQKHATWCCQGTLDKCPAPPLCMACLRGRTDHAEWCNADIPGTARYTMTFGPHAQEIRR